MKTDIKKHENGGAKSWIKAHLSDIIPVLGLILVLVFFNAVSGGKVFTKTNFNTLFNEAFSLLIVTYALIFVMAQGKNDMSLGGVVALAAALAAHASSISGNLVLPVALLVGLLCGLLNGLIVTELRIDSFIATIAMSFILKGFVELLLQSGVQSIPIKMMMLDTQQLKITVALVFGIISFILFKFTMFGKHCRAIGSRLEVCRQSGVRVKLVQYGSYVFTGLASGLVAFFFLIRSGAANAIHRIACFAATTLDSMPYSGAILMLLPMCRMKLKEIYPPMFITTVIATTCGTIAVIVMCALFPGLC